MWIFNYTPQIISNICTRVGAQDIKSGAHSNADDGMCIMEAINFAKDAPHSDDPACVSEYLRNKCINVNDNTLDDERQALKQIGLMTVGSATCEPLAWFFR